MEGRCYIAEEFTPGSRDWGPARHEGQGTIIRECSGMSAARTLLGGAAESRKDLLKLREPPETERLLSGQ